MEEVFWQFTEVAVELWPGFLAFSHVMLAGAASMHAITFKREPQATVGWVGLVWLSPFLGAFIYWLLGINRVRSKAKNLRDSKTGKWPQLKGAPTPPSADIHLDDEPSHRLQSYAQRILGHGLTYGNEVEVFHDGDLAYQAMLDAIKNAEKSVILTSYIFDTDAAGELFVAALAAAKQRGVEVRVLIDGAGANYSLPTIARLLRRHQIRFAKFLPTNIPWHMAYINLRNHRKILVVDGALGFTGGMNIRAGYLRRGAEHPAIIDLHFCMRGPIVQHLLATAADDWRFSSGESLDGPRWWPPLTTGGSVAARGIPDGPDRHFENIQWIILGAIALAKKRICILTPYFLPDTATAKALSVAAMAGIEVEIILPEANNLKFVQWASLPSLPYLIERGCKLYYSPPPFDHSKLMVVDDYWTLVGSSNWDPRSFRLNFEFNVECYDHELAHRVHAVFDEKKKSARLLTTQEFARQPYWAKLRNGLARLFTPYL